MKRIKILALAVLGVGALTAASVSVASMPLPMGWYIDGNVGSTKVSNTNYGSGLTETTSGIGTNLNLGYKFMPYLAAEIGYTRYANGKLKFNNVSVAKVKSYSYDIAAKGMLPISDSGVELYTKLGIARLSSRVSITDQTTLNSNGVSVSAGTQTATALYLAIGGDYNITPNTAVHVQWARAKGNSKTGNIDLISIGVGYLFG